MTSQDLSIGNYALALPVKLIRQMPAARRDPGLPMRAACDFCGTTHPAPGWSRVYKTVPFMFDGEVLGADWSACYQCAVLIDLRRSEALLDRCSLEFDRSSLALLFQHFTRARL